MKIAVFYEENHNNSQIYEKENVEIKNIKKTSKFIRLISRAEQVLLIDGRWKNLGKGVCELYIKVYLPNKFHADIFCSHWGMFHTKFNYEKTTKGNNSIIRKWRVIVLVQYTSTH